MNLIKLVFKNEYFAHKYDPLGNKEIKNLFSIILILLCLASFSAFIVYYLILFSSSYGYVSKYNIIPQNKNQRTGYDDVNKNRTYVDGYNYTTFLSHFSLTGNKKDNYFSPAPNDFPKFSVSETASSSVKNHNVDEPIVERRLRSNIIERIVTDGVPVFQEILFTFFSKWCDFTFVNSYHFISKNMKHLQNKLYDAFSASKKEANQKATEWFSHFSKYLLDELKIKDFNLHAEKNYKQLWIQIVKEKSYSYFELYSPNFLQDCLIAFMTKLKSRKESVVMLKAIDKLIKGKAFLHWMTKEELDRAKHDLSLKDISSDELKMLDVYWSTLLNVLTLNITGNKISPKVETSLKKIWYDTFLSSKSVLLEDKPIDNLVVAFFKHLMLAKDDLLKEDKTFNFIDSPSLRMVRSWSDVVSLANKKEKKMLVPITQ